MMPKKKPPVFVGKSDLSSIPDELRDLGIRLSSELPTYDVPIDMIEPNNWNPNVMDDPMFDRLVQEMEESGVISPIQIVPSEGGRFRIIGGEHRWAGARTLGKETIPCNVLLDEKFVGDSDLQKFLTVRLNKISGDIDIKKMIKLKTDLAKKYGDKQLRMLFGYTRQDAWNKLVTGLEDAIDKTGISNPKLKSELKKKARKTKTVDGLAKVLKNLFKKYGSDLKYSFMVFSFGGKNHLYIIANEETQKALEKVKSICEKRGLDINDVIGPAIQSIPSGYGGDKEKDA
jgi:hypothetical protein